MWFGANDPGQNASGPPAVTREEIAKIAVGTHEALQAQETHDEEALAGTIQRSVNHIRARISGALSHRKNQITDWFRQGSSEHRRAELDVGDQQGIVDETRKEKTEKEQNLRKVLVQVRASSVSRYPLIRVLPTPVYAVLLVIAAGAMGVLNTATFQMLSVADGLVYVLAAFTAGVHGMAIHIVPHGFNRGARRGVAFWISLIVLALQAATAVLLSQLRGDFLTVLEVSLEPWSVIALPLLADFVALLAAIIYRSEDATALRQATRDLRRAMKALQKAQEDLSVALSALDDAANNWYSGVERLVGEVHAGARFDGEAIIEAFFMDLLKLGPLPAAVLQRVDTSVELPDGLEAFEDWLVEMGRKLGRPPSIRRREHAPITAAEEE